MKKFVILLFLCVSTSLASKRPDRTNIYETEASKLFTSEVSDISKLDFSNLRALFLPLDDYSAWQQLKNGRGRTQVTVGNGIWEAVDVQLVWKKQLDPKHMLVAYVWVWVAATSSESEVIQLFELRDGKAYIIQQIVADLHGGYPSVGAAFEENGKQLTVKSVELDSPLGRCCPRFLNVVDFSWNGAKLQRLRARRAYLQKQK